MNLTIDQINLALNDKTLGPEILEYDDFSNLKTDPVESLGDEDLEKFGNAIVHAMRDWYGSFQSYNNPPLMEMEPEPLSICGIDGLYIVCYMAWEANEFTFFTTKADAEVFADKQYKQFLDLCKVITGEDAE